MSTRLSEFLRRFRRSAVLPDSDEETDGQLLERVAAHRDRVALETLVRRHAPMVWGVCRRTLAHRDQAEDAFQATFLVLVRKAAGIRSRELLANWLYGVAQKTARKARQMAAKRGTREGQVLVMPEPPAEPHGHEFGPEMRAGLDEELSRLPEKYRAIILLCDLQGRTRAEVARQLRLAEGTVGSRLARGRALLAQRLTRRGLSALATSLAAISSEQALSGSVPAAVLASTIAAGTLVATETTVAGMIAAEVSLLTQRVLHGMAVEKWTKASGLLLVMAALALAGGALAHRALSDQANEPEPPPHLVEKAELAPQIGEKANPDPDIEEFGSAAGATDFAIKLLHGTFDPHMWPTIRFRCCAPRTFDTAIDRDKHQWSVAGDARHAMLTKKFKWIIGYDPAT